MRKLKLDHKAGWEGGVCYPLQGETIKFGLEGAKAFAFKNDIKIAGAEKRANEKFQQGGLL